MFLVQASDYTLTGATRGLIVTQAGPIDHSATTSLATSRGARWAYLAAGHTFVALGVIGAFLPVMPTTIFLILAASCYARASTRFYNKLLNHPTVGPVILDWREHRAMKARTKGIAIATIAVTFAITIAVLPDLWLKLLHVGIGLALVAFIARIRTRG